MYYCVKDCLFVISKINILLSDSLVFFFFKQKTAYEMRISDWSSDVCSSDLPTTIDETQSESKRVHAPRFPVVVDRDRDALLTDFGKETLNDRYLLPGESYQDRKSTRLNSSH